MGAGGLVWWVSSDWWGLSDSLSGLVVWSGGLVWWSGLVVWSGGLVWRGEAGGEVAEQAPRVAVVRGVLIVSFH